MNIDINKPCINRVHGNGKHIINKQGNHCDECTSNEDFDKFEQAIENVNTFLESNNLSVMQAVLERIVIAYVSVSNGHALSNPLQTTERQAGILIRRLNDSNRADLADAVVNLLDTTKVLLEQLQ